MKKFFSFLLVLCVAITGVLGTSVVVFKGDIYAETGANSEQGKSNNSGKQVVSPQENGQSGDNQNNSRQDGNSSGEDSTGKGASQDKRLSSQVATNDERAENTAIGDPYLLEVFGKDVKDGTYDIKTDDSSAMFNIVSAKLSVKSGKMSAVITLSGKGYMKLFMGTGFEAVKADDSMKAMYKEVDGKYTYEIPVESLNKPLDCTAYSFRRKKWYDHQVIFLADSLPKDAVKIDMKANLLNKEDGEYQVDVKASSEEKAAGKVQLISPAKIKVENGRAVATIVWKEGDFDYLIVYGRKYFAKSGESLPTFEIPVANFNKDIKVIANRKDIKPNAEIGYVFNFDKDSIKMETRGIFIKIAIAAAVIVIILAIVFAVRRNKKAARGTSTLIPLPVIRPTVSGAFPLSKSMLAPAEARAAQVPVV